MGHQQPLRVLVAEDEMIIGYDLCDTVSEAGYIVEGPFVDLSSAMLAYQKTKPEIAILDVQLGDGIVYPLAEQMMAENVPVIFHSGQLTLEEVGRFPTEFDKVLPLDLQPGVRLPHFQHDGIP